MSKRLTPQERLWRSVPESQVVRDVIAYCVWRGGYAYRQNTGSSSFSNPGSATVRFVQFGEKGASDVIAIFPCPPRVLGCTGLVFFIECKTERGKQSDDQKAWQANVEAAGGTYLLCRPSNWQEQIDRVLAEANKE